MEMRTFMGEDENEETQDEHSPGGLAVETLSNIKTVASLTLEAERADEYDIALKHEDPHPMRSNLIKGSLSGTGQCIQMWSFAIMFWFGGYLLLNYPESFTYRSYLISMFSLFFSMYGLTLAFEGTVDREKAKAAAQRIFTLADRKSLIDPLSDDGVIILDDGTVQPVPKSNRRSKELRSAEDQSQCQPIPCYRVWLIVTLAALIGLGAGVGIGYKKA
jgi:ATP-binding cassette, subfamily B (MDR/TAP), member 1